MKKIVLISTLFLTFIGFSQEDKVIDLKKNEIKINAFNFLVFSSLDVSYERFITEESTVGISVLLNLKSENSRINDDGPFYYESYAVVPYYRLYFGRKPTVGFFIEGFGMYSSGKYDNYDEVLNIDTNFYDYSYTYDAYSDFALGIAVGGKFKTKRGFVLEIYGGVGRNLFNTDVSPEMVPRVGIGIGKQF